jgi:hypothetical protein
MLGSQESLLYSSPLYFLRHGLLALPRALEQTETQSWAGSSAGPARSSFFLCVFIRAAATAPFVAEDDAARARATGPVGALEQPRSERLSLARTRHHARDQLGRRGGWAGEGSGARRRGRRERRDREAESRRAAMRRTRRRSTKLSLSACAAART